MEKKEYIKMLIPAFAIGIIIVILIVVMRNTEGGISVKTVLKYTPENTCLTMAVLFLFFALASGILFSPFMALFVSTCGLAITLTIPYLIGYFSGKKVVQSIQERYPKAQKIMEYQRENTFFACFITRIVGVLPGDIVSLYFGACNTRYDIYLIAGIAGSLLSIITTTILGEKISHPFSIGFFVVLLCRVLVSSGSIFTNYILNKRKEEDF